MSVKAGWHVPLILLKIYGYCALGLAEFKACRVDGEELLMVESARVGPPGQSMP